VRTLIKLSIRSIFSSSALVVVFVVVAALVSAIVAVIAGVVAFAPAQAAGTLEAGTAAGYLGMTAYLTAAVVTGVSFATLFSTPFLREKEEGNVEALLATPVTVGRLWMAKSIALAVVGSAAALVCALVVAVVLWRAWTPALPFDLPGLLIVDTFLMVPLVYSALALLVYRIAIPGRVVDGAILVSVFLTGFSTVMLNVAVRGVIPPDTWGFALLHVGWILLLLAPSFLLRASLTREKAIQ
jgi:hypothetical protein